MKLILSILAILGLGAGGYFYWASQPKAADSAEVSRSYGTRTIRSLPVLDRQAQELIWMMPGITPPTVSDDRILDPHRTRTFNVNGQPSFANIDHIDGSQNTEAVTRQVSRMTPNEAIEALSIRTSNYNAEYGFSGGSWSNVSTRPGTNAVHGSLFGFNTKSFFATRNPLNPTGNPDPRFNINQFGGTLGGPIAKDKMFFFLSYDAYLRRGNELRFATVPSDALLAGNFTADERMAAFLVSLSRRQAVGGFSPSRLHLTMTRTDIANYLRLASESVSRGFSRLQDAGIVRVDRRDIEISDPAKLAELARHILRE